MRTLGVAGIEGLEELKKLTLVDMEVAPDLAEARISAADNGLGQVFEREHRGDGGQATRPLELAEHLLVK